MAAGFPDLDFEGFQRDELPRRLARWGALAAASPLPLRPLGFRLSDGPDSPHSPGGAAFSLIPEPSGMRAVAGDAEAETLIELDHEAWQGLMHDLESVPGLLYSRRARAVRGDAMKFVAWEASLRAVLHGIPIYDPAAVDLRDRRGAPLDPEAGFGLDADRDEMAHFLDTVGYLLVKSVFDRDEVARLVEAGEVLRERARPGDQTSWWGRDREGREVLCRVIQAGVLPAFRDVHGDPRVRELARLAPGGLVPRDAERTNGVAVLWKNPAMQEGLSDLPWHRDCGMGGHAVTCPTMVVSLYLADATPESGELRFLPGSWRCSYPFAEAGDERAARGVGIRAEAGDLTLHYGDGMHCAPPPSGDRPPFRSSVLIGFARPGARHHRGEDHYNDVLLDDGDGQVKHLAQVADGAGRAKTPEETSQ